MAVITAFLIGDVDSTNGPNLDPDQFNAANPSVDQGWEHRPATASGPLVNTQPRAPQSRAISSYNIGFFTDDFYHGIWMLPVNTINLGFVPSAIDHEFYVWNSYRVGKTLDAITEIDTDGLTLDPATTPDSYLPDELKLHTLTADPEGPPNIDATFTFDFEGELSSLFVAGIRVVGWTIKPNWIDPVLERGVWRTDLQRSYSGKEQRRQLYDGPRIEWEFTFDTSEDERRLLDNLLFNSGGRIFALPQWPDRRSLATDLAIASTVIDVDTDNTDFHADGLIILLGPNSTFEALQVESLTSSQLTLRSETTLFWPAGTSIYPARPANLMDPRGFQNLTGDYARGRARFKTVDEVTRPEVAEQQYRGRPVLNDQPNWRTPAQLDHTRLLEIIDYGTGPTKTYDKSDQAFPTLRFLWSAMSRTEAEALHNFVWCRRGRQKSVWIPTWTNDLRAVQFEQSSLALDVGFCGLVAFAAGNIHRKDIRIEMQDGTVFYRRLGALSTVVEGVTERALLDSGLGQDYAAEDFKRISWLMLMRSEADSIEISWYTEGIAEVTMTLRGPKHDV